MMPADAQQIAAISRRFAIDVRPAFRATPHRADALLAEDVQNALDISLFN
jgi:hypothetical protein